MSDDRLIRLGNSIRDLRKKQKLSIEQLADRADIHLTYLAQIEKGQRNMSIKTLWSIAAALDVEAVSLISENSPIKTRDGHLDRIINIMNTLDASKQEMLLKVVKELAAQLTGLP